MIYSRRHWLRTTSLASLGVITGAAVTGCGEQTLAPLVDPEEGHLVSRPTAAVLAPTTGVTALRLGGKRDGWRYVPSSYKPGDVLPLLVTLHGYGGDGYGTIQSYLQWADDNRVVLLSPDSRNVSWDRRFGSFDVDARFIDNALSETFLRVGVSTSKIALAGYSDGASYALSLGLTNGDLFQQLLAFSPGFMLPNVARNTPTVFVSHGTQDTVLNIDRTSRVFVPKLRDAGYNVTYREFDGGHQLSSAVKSEGLAWLATKWGLPG